MQRYRISETRCAVLPTRSDDAFLTDTHFKNPCDTYFKLHYKQGLGGKHLSDKLYQPSTVVEVQHKDTIINIDDATILHCMHLLTFVYFMYPITILGVFQDTNPETHKPTGVHFRTPSVPTVVSRANSSVRRLPQCELPITRCTRCLHPTKDRRSDVYTWRRARDEVVSETRKRGKWGDTKADVKSRQHHENLPQSSNR